MSLHYFGKCTCSKFLANTGFITVRLLVFGVKVKRGYCRDNFLAQRLIQDMRRLSQDEFLCFNRTAQLRTQNTSVAFLGQERRDRRVIVKRLLCTVQGAHCNLLTCTTRSFAEDNNINSSSTNCDDFEPICHDNY